MAETDKLARRDGRRPASRPSTPCRPCLSMFTRDVPHLRIIILGGEACRRPSCSAGAAPGPSDLQHLRPDRGDGGRHGLRGAAAASRSPSAARSRTTPATWSASDMNLVASRRRGRTAHRRPRRRAGLSAARRADGREVHRQPVRVRRRRSDPLPLRRRGGASTPTARIVFHGRIDDQVKIRGFRVELGEIEVKLDELPGVAQAAVVLRNDDGLDRLVAFIVPEQGSGIDRMQVRVALRRAAARPTWCRRASSSWTTLPRLSPARSTARRCARMPLAATADRTEEQEAARTRDRGGPAAGGPDACSRGQSLPFDADFFTELGGHSLLAARFVSAVRETPSLAGITLQDVYGRARCGPWPRSSMAAPADGRRRRTVLHARRR